MELKFFVAAFLLFAILGSIALLFSFQGTGFAVIQPAYAKLCKDSDNGMMPYSAGCTTLGNQKSCDFCASGNSLNEFYCKGNRVDVNRFACRGKCLNVWLPGFDLNVGRCI